MIKICYVVGQLSKHGAEKQLYELVRGINKNLYHPIVISLSKGGYWSKEIKKLNIEYYELERRKNLEFARLFKLIKLLFKIKPDIVHSYLFPANSYARVAAFVTRVPIIIASERNAGEIGQDKKKYQIFIDKLLSSFSDGIICNSYVCSENLVKKYSFDNKKIFTVQNGIHLMDFIKGTFTSKDNNKKVVGTIARLYPQKNHKLFLDMAKYVIDIYKEENIQFLIVGDGPLRNELEIYTRNLGIEKFVVFTGERTDIPELLHEMDIYVMTSLYEGLSNSIMEAMMAECPVVASDVGGNRELIIDGKTGFLYPTKDTSALVEKVIWLLEHQKEAKEMGREGKKKIKNEFGVEGMVNKTETIYYSLLEKRNIYSSFF